MGWGRCKKILEEKKRNATFITKSIFIRPFCKKKTYYGIIFSTILPSVRTFVVNFFLCLLDEFDFITGWERTGQMLCIVDTSLSVLMTLRMCLRELCCLFTVWI